MAGIASTDVTVTISVRDRDIAHGRAGKNITVASVTFGDGALTYPTGGVPLPAIGVFGYQREVAFVDVQQPVGNGFDYRYDETNHKLKIRTQGFVTGSTAATACESGALVENSAAAEGSARLANTAVDTTYDMGGLIELPATIAPAAVTVKLLMFGE